MKLYPHEIHKTLQEKQSVKLSPCKKHSLFQRSKLLESQILGRNLKDASTECKSEK